MTRLETREALARVLDEHEDYGLYSNAGGSTHYVCKCDKIKRPGTHRAHLAAALLAAVEAGEVPGLVTSDRLVEVWDEGMRTGSSRAMRRMSDEPTLPLAGPNDNPYRPEGGGCGSCLACDPPRISDATGLPIARMYVCATCGNKRCPASIDCQRWECSGSNEPGQVPVRREGGGGDE